VVDIQDLHVVYGSGPDAFPAVNGISFAVRPGEAFGLVGESGSGKTTTAMAMLRLLRPPARIAGGRIEVNGVDITSVPTDVLRAMRWKQIALIPQGAMNALNPVISVGKQIRECFTAHGERRRSARRRDDIVELLVGVGLRPEVYDRYPHELSGGMKQRVCIAMATALRPDVIVADEPTSSLDVVVQRQVVESIRRVQTTIGAALVFIGHDLALQAQVVDRIAVMHRGRLVELGATTEVFAGPRHWYTRMLIAAVPSLPGRESAVRAFEVDELAQRGASAGAELEPLRQVGPDHYAAVAQ
jgi:ABC-type dipeptide/oligopeptide/nickel transport system ATPase component